MIYLAAARDAHDKREIDDIGWVKTTDNFAEALQKLWRYDKLEKFLDTGMFRQNMSHWIVRGEVKK